MLDLPDLKFYDYHESVGEKKKENLTDDILSKVKKKINTPLGINKEFYCNTKKTINTENITGMCCVNQSHASQVRKISTLHSSASWSVLCLHYLIPLTMGNNATKPIESLKYSNEQ